MYDPAVDAQGAPRLMTSLPFYRGRVKVFEQGFAFPRLALYGG